MSIEIRSKMCLWLDQLNFYVISSQICTSKSECQLLWGKVIHKPNILLPKRNFNYNSILFLFFKEFFLWIWFISCCDNFWFDLLGSATSKKSQFNGSFWRDISILIFFSNLKFSFFGGGHYDLSKCLALFWTYVDSLTEFRPNETRMTVLYVKRCLSF